jgi:hypothetical protein
MCALQEEAQRFKADEERKRVMLDEANRQRDLQKKRDLDEKVLVA